MMTDIKDTTLPLAPSGVTTTEMPLGVTTRTTIDEIPQNVQPQELSVFEYPTPTYLGSFTISQNTQVGVELFNWDSIRPMGNNASIYNTGVDREVDKKLVQFHMFPYYFSRFAKYNILLSFKPIKVGDCRAAIDGFINYETGYTTAEIPYEAYSFNNDNFHIEFDDPNCESDIMVPLYWATTLSRTDVVYVWDSTKNELTSVMPVYLPRTNVKVKLANRYQPNSLQPPSFEVLVLATIIPYDLIGCAQKSPLDVRLVSTNTETPRPALYVHPSQAI